MSATTPPAASPFATSIRMLSTALMGGLIFIGIALFFVLPTDETLPLWVPAAQLAAGVVVHLVLEAVGYRLQPLEPSLTDEDATAQARTRFQAAMTLRFAACELIAIASVALSFVLSEGGFMIYVGGMIVSLVLMYVHVWPWARPVGKSAERLETAGKPSGLRQEFGILS